MTKRVLSIGQCQMDHGALSRFLKSAFDVEIVAVATGPEALGLAKQQPFDLVLVNRKLDIDYSDGLDVINTFQADPALKQTPVMLVTNYPEHQDNAVAAGAQRGFGKNDLGRSDVVEQLQPYLGAA